MDQKELLDAIEEKVSVAKKDWQKEVDKKGSDFESKLEKAIDKLVEESKGETNSEKLKIQKRIRIEMLKPSEKMTQPTR